MGMRTVVPPNPYDLGDAFAAHYGGQTTHGIVSGMQAGQAPAMSAVGPVNGAATGVASTPPTTPAEAGTNNAIMPGSSNGNPAIGVPSAEVSAAPSANAPSAPSPGPVAGGQTVAPPPAPPPATPPARVPLTPPAKTGDVHAAAAAQAGEDTRAADLAGPGVPAKSAAKPNAAGHEKIIGGIVGGIVAANHGHDDSPNDTPVHAPPPTGTQFNFNGKSWVSDKPKPANWPGMTGQEQRQWLEKNAHQANATQTTGLEALKGLDQYKDVVLPDQPLAQPVHLWSGSTDPEIDAALGGSDLGRLAKSRRQLQSEYETIPVPGSAAQGRQRQDLSKQIAALDSTLGAYGVTFGAKPETPGGGPAGGTTPIDDAVHNNQGASGSPSDPNSNTDLANAGAGDVPQDKKLIADLIQTYGPEKGMAMYELLNAKAQQVNQDANRQSAVNLTQSGIEGYQGSDAYKGIQGLTGEILSHPTTTNWDLVRTKTVSDSDAAFAENQDALSRSFARRGIDPASGAGIAGELNRERSGDIASRLGDLEIQRGQIDRQQQLQALQAGIGGFGATSGFDMANYSNLANLVTGNPAQYGNFASGVGSAFLNADAASAAIDQAEQAGKFSWGDALELAGKLAGAAAMV
jgi:hypothetical protein